MNDKNFKIAIIGGGLIGFYLAWKLSEQGHNVSVFDKKKENEIGKKVCSALFSERIKDFIPGSEKCVKNKINGCIINFSKKKIRLEFSPSHLVMDRERLSKILMDLAKKSGAQIFFDQEIDRLPIGFDYIIGCDGAGSTVRRLLNLPDPKIALGAQVFSQKRDNSNHVFTHPIRNGFCWKIPTGDCVEYGIMDSPASVEKSFKDFLKNEQIDSREKIFSAAIPQPGSVLKDAGLIFPKEKNITLCGDASGLTKPWSGGGVIWGLTQADILLKTFPDFEEYKKQAVKRFRWLVLKGQISKKMVYFMGNYFPYLIPSELTYDNDFPSLFKSLIGSLFNRNV
jgi:flavin-dependent dehydrogenase